jgi:ParB-like chromosome segregation protein Spo0J
MAATPSAARDVALSEIATPQNRARALRGDAVGMLAKSLRERGLLNPITLRPQEGGGFALIAGHHRLEAARSLGWATIPAIILVGLDAVEAELCEIDENLIRAELTPAEQAAHHARRKELYEQRHPDAKHGGDRKSTNRKSNPHNADMIGYSEDAAAKTGKSRDTIERAVRRGKSIPDVGGLAGTSLDKGAELDALAKLGDIAPDRQAALVEKAKGGELVSAKDELASIAPPHVSTPAPPDPVAKFDVLDRQVDDDFPQLMALAGQMVDLAWDIRNFADAPDMLHRIKDAYDKATGWWAWMQAARKPDIRRQAYFLRWRAARGGGRLIEMMHEAKLFGDGRPPPGMKIGTRGSPYVYRDFGIAKVQAAEWMDFADMSEEDFEAQLAKGGNPSPRLAKLEELRWQRSARKEVKAHRGRRRTRRTVTRGNRTGEPISAITEARSIDGEASPPAEADPKPDSVTELMPPEQVALSAGVAMAEDTVDPSSTPIPPRTDRSPASSTPMEAPPTAPVLHAASTSNSEAAE